jgi:hypothetical protein
VHNCNPSYSEGRDWRIAGSRLVQAKLTKVSKKQKIQTKRARGMAQVVRMLA